jgi:hypothetical protein
MAVTFRQATSSTTATVNKPPALANGDIIIASATNGSGTYPTTPSGWTVIASTQIASGISVRRWYRQITNAAGEPSTYTFTNASSVLLHTFYGQDVNDPIDTFASDTSASGSDVTFAATVADFNGTFAIAYGSLGTTASSSHTVPSGWLSSGTVENTASIRRSINAGTLASFTYTLHSTSYSAAGILVLIRPSVDATSVAPRATATGSMPAPSISAIIDASVAGETASASATHLEPDILAGSVVVAEAGLSTAIALAPSILVSATVSAQVALANALATVPSATSGALVVAESSSASASILAPDVVFIAIVHAEAAQANASHLAPIVVGGALVAGDLAAATAIAIDPQVNLSIPAPLATASALALDATALGSAILRPLPGVSVASAVAPKAGVDKRAGSWRGRRMSVSLVGNQAAADLAATISAIYDQRLTTGTQARRVVASATVSSSAISATQEKRENE